MISEQTVERVKQMMNVVDVVGAFLTLKKKGSDLVTTCPFHAEKTPSFYVSHSKQIYKCFGCGKSGDAIEFLKEHEKFTFEQSIEWLIRRYNIERIEVEAKKIVRPIARVQKVGNDILKFFEVGRKINNNTLLRFNVTQADEWMPKADKVVPAICFNYYRKGELVNIKFRANNKDFKLNKDSELIFYNLDAIKDEEEVVIVEGEIDCLSCYEDQIYNCISVPNGANVKGELKLEYLDNCWEELKDKKRFIIMTDNDEAGRRLRDELGRRLGYRRCVQVIYPDGCKDANEVWIKYGKGSLQKMIETSIDWPLDGILTMMDMMDEVISFYENGYPKGFEIPIPGFRKHMQLMLGQVTGVTGIPGHGKSEMVDYIMVEMSRVHGWKWGIVSPENQPSSLHATKLIQKFAKKSFAHRDNPLHRMTKQELAIAMQWVQDHFHFINVDDADISIPGIYEKAEDLVGKVGIHGLTLDPWNKLKHNKIDMDHIREGLNHISHKSKLLQIHTIIVVHPTKMKKVKVKGREVYEIPTLYSMSGSADFNNMLDNGLTVYRDTQTGIVDVYRQKIRYNWLGDIGFSSYRFDWDTQQYLPVEASILDRPGEDSGEDDTDDLPF